MKRLLLLCGLLPGTVLTLTVAAHTASAGPFIPTRPQDALPSKPQDLSPHIPGVPNVPQLDPTNIPGVGQKYTKVYIENRSGRHIRVAINYTSRTGIKSRPEGWWTLRPGEKAYVVDANGSVGFFAETTDKGGHRWWGRD